LSAYQEQFAERTQVTDRPAQNGDMLVIDFKGFVDGNQFDGANMRIFQSLYRKVSAVQKEKEPFSLKTPETNAVTNTNTYQTSEALSLCGLLCAVVLWREGKC